MQNKSRVDFNNWQNLGLSSKEEALAVALNAIEKNAKGIMKHGVKIDDEVEPIQFFVKGRMFTLTNRGFRK